MLGGDYVLNENKEVAEKYNLLQWHERGYTGRNIRVALFDETPFMRENMKGYCSIPFPTGATSPTHATNVAAVLHEFAPDAEILMLELATTNDIKLRNAKWIADPANRIDLISCSYLDIGFESEEYWQVIKNSGIPFFAAAGNGNKERSKGERCSPPCFDWTFAIGGINDTTGQKVSYSNYGDMLTCMTYAAPYIQNDAGDIFPISGTSFCQPQACAIIACLLQAAKDMGIAYTRESLLEFIAANCKDYYEPGKDDMSGYGLLVLPDVDKYLEDNAMKIIEMWIGNKTALVDGEPSVMSVPPKIENGSTLIPIRFVSEALGCKVEYSGIEKKITITM